MRSVRRSAPIRRSMNRPIGRDPFVFWNEDERCWWMLVAARRRACSGRNGCVGLCVSDDLLHWRAEGPVYAPDIHPAAYECPDMFRMGDWWYLVFSNYTGRVRHLLSDVALAAGSMGASRDRHLRFPRVLCGENRQRRRQPLPVRMGSDPWGELMGFRSVRGVWCGLPDVELGRIHGGAPLGTACRRHAGYRALGGCDRASGLRADAAGPPLPGSGAVAR